MNENKEIHKDMNNTAADESLAWEEVSVEHIVQDKWIDFRRAAYRFPDGTTLCRDRGVRRRGQLSLCPAVSARDQTGDNGVRGGRH